MVNVGVVPGWFLLPTKPWWLITGIAKDGPVEARFILLKLPSWGFAPVISMNALAWGQRMLVYNGRKGFSVQWHFSEEALRNATSLELH